MHSDPIMNERRISQALCPLGGAELAYLAAILEQPCGPEFLAAFLRARLKRQGWPAGPAALRDSDDLRRRETLYFILNCRCLFPSTRDVIEAVNNAFGCRFDYEDFRRSGRLDLVCRTWTYLLSLGELRREDLLRRFIQSIRCRQTAPPDPAPAPRPQGT